MFVLPRHLPRLPPVTRLDIYPCRRYTSIMTKRANWASYEAAAHANKKLRKEGSNMYNKIATAENAAAVDAHPPLQILLQAVDRNVKDPEKGDAVVYWMRLEDMRSMSYICLLEKYP